MGQTALNDSVRAIEAEIAAGRPERALALCQDAQAAHPRALAVLRVMGEVYLAMRKTREAVGALDRALAGNPEDARACCARAIVQQMQGDSMGALAWYRRACDIRPDDTVLRSAYRELATPLGQPAYTPTRMGLARLYLRGDLFPHAIREFETLLAEQPDSLEAQVGLAETFWRARRPQTAAECCRRILVNTPSCVKALLILAVTEQTAGNTDEAQRLVKRAAELDPDARIGQELFADQLAAGDPVPRMLLFGAEPPTARVTNVPVPQPYAPPQPQPQAQPQSPSQPLRPAAASQPLQPSSPAPRPAAQQTQPLAPEPSAQARPANLPPDFHTIFAETEYMLWGHDDETVGRVAAISRANGQPRPDTFAGSSIFLPPAFQQGSPLDDTEARAAINWLSWLQAQGARPHGVGQSGLPGATGPLPPPPAGTGPLVPPPTGPLPWELSASYAPPQNGQVAPAQPWRETGQLPPPPPPTGPLPPPTPEALRQMFAELAPEPSTSRIVDGSLADDSLVVESSSGSAAASDSGDDDDGAGTLNASWGAATGDAMESPFVSFEAESEPPSNGAAPAYEPPWSDSQAAEIGWMPAGDPQENIAHPHGETWVDDAPDAPIEDVETGALPADVAAEMPSSAPIAEPELTANGAQHEEEPASPVTLEALERGFAQSGFQSFELHPGGLAAMSSVTDDAVPSAAEPYDAPEPAHEAASVPFATPQHDDPAPSEWASADDWANDAAPAHDAPAAEWSLEDQETGPLSVVETGPVEALPAAASQPLEPASAPAEEVAGERQPAGDATSAQHAPEIVVEPQEQAVPLTDVDVSDTRSPSVPLDVPGAASEPALAHDDYAGRLALARQRRGDGQMDDALTEYRIILKNSPDLLADVMGDLRDSLAEQPEHPELHRLLGDAHIRQGDYLSALESYNRAVALTQAQGN